MTFFLSRFRARPIHPRNAPTIPLTICSSSVLPFYRFSRHISLFLFISSLPLACTLLAGHFLSSRFFPIGKRQIPIHFLVPEAAKVFLKQSVYSIDSSRHTEKVPRRLRARHDNTSQFRSRPSDHVLTGNLPGRPRHKRISSESASWVGQLACLNRHLARRVAVN